VSSNLTASAKYLKKPLYLQGLFSYLYFYPSTYPTSKFEGKSKNWLLEDRIGNEYKKHKNLNSILVLKKDFECRKKADE
jgi:hypothetical protein